MLFKVQTGDSMEERWKYGVYAGRIEQTDEALCATPEGIQRSRAIRRLEEGHRHDTAFLDSCVGVPWNPRGVTASEAPLIQRGDPSEQERGLDG